MIFGLDNQNEVGCGTSGIELTGFTWDVNTKDMVITASVATLQATCFNGKKSLIALISYQGLVQWVRSSNKDATITQSEALISPLFFRTVTDVGPPAVLTTFIFAVVTTLQTAFTYSVGTPYVSQTQALYGPQFVISKIQASDGVMVGEIKYSLTNVNYFTEIRLATDPPDTIKDSLYVVTSIKGVGTGLIDFTANYFQGLFIKISSTAMTIVKYSYFNQGYDNSIFDSYVDSAGSYMYAFGRMKLSTVSTTNYLHPWVSKLTTLDYTVVDFAYASNINQRQAYLPTVQTPTIGRICVCETQNNWFAAFNRDHTAVFGFSMLSGKTNPTMMITHYYTTAALTTFNPIAGQTQYAFDMYYKCGTAPADSYVSFVFAQAATMYMARIELPNPGAAAATTFNMKFRTFSRGTVTKPITSVFTRFIPGDPIGIIAWNQNDYFVPSTTNYATRIVLHRVSLFSATMDFTSNMCSATTAGYSGADTTVVIKAVDPTNINLLASGTTPLLPVTVNCPNVVAGDPIIAVQFTAIINSYIVLTFDPSFTTTDINDKVYLMFDIPYSVPTQCSMTNCHTINVDCNPPYDWGPKSYTIELIPSLSSPYYVNLPTIKDCLGRNMFVYSTPANPAKPMSNANAFDGTLKDDILLGTSLIPPTASAPGQLSISLTAADTDSIGSRTLRFKAKIGGQFDKPVFMRLNIVPDPGNIRHPKDEMNPSNDIDCSYDKIFPFLIGHSQDVNVTSMQIDAYGNFLYAGWAYKAPYGWDGSQQTSWATTVQQGYVALIDKRGMPFWAYRVKDEQKTGVIPGGTVCTYARHMRLVDDDYVFAGCNMWRTDLVSSVAVPIVSGTIGLGIGNQEYWQVPVLLKLKYETGEIVFSRYLPVDSWGNSMQQNILFAEQIGTWDATGAPLTTSNNIYAVWRYRQTVNPGSKIPQQTFAAVRFNDQTFQHDAFSVFTSPNFAPLTIGANGGWFPISVISDQNYFYAVVTADKTVGTVVYKVSNSDLATGNTGIITSAVTATNDVIYSMIPALYPLDRLLVPILDNVNLGSTSEKLTLAMLYRSNLLAERQVVITFPVSTNLRSAAVTVDSDGFIYLTASEYQMVFFKFSSTLDILPAMTLPPYYTYRRIFKGTTGFYNLLTAQIFDGSLWFGYAGKYLPTSKQSALIIRSTLDLDFNQYTCGFLIDDYRSWDTTWYPTIAAPQVGLPSVNGANTVTPLSVTAGVNYPKSPWVLIPEAFSFTLRTISFYIAEPNSLNLKIGAEPLPTFYKYPETGVKCNLYEVLDQYQNLEDVDGTMMPKLSYEFTQKTGKQPLIITKAISQTVKSCQGHYQSFKQIEPHQAGGTIPAWLELDELSDKVMVDTDLDTPQSAYVTIRYYNDFYPTATAKDYYYEFPILITVKAAAEAVPLEQNLEQIKSCTQNIFPMSFGGDGVHINYAIFIVNEPNLNILLAGKSQIFPADDGATYDGFVMRITPLGFVQWISYLSSRYVQDEYVAGVISQGSGANQNVYAWYHSAHPSQAYKTSAICKLTYLEGRLVWAKQVMYQDPWFSPPETIYRDMAFFMDPDPHDQTQLFISSSLQYGSPTVRGFYPTVTMLKDMGTELKVITNHHLRPQRTTAAVQTTKPSMSNFVFDDTGVGVIFASTHMYDPASDTLALMFTRINQVDNTVDWNFYFAPHASMPIEPSTFPNLYQRKGKVFAAQPCTGAASNVGLIFLTTINTITGAVGLQKTYLGDANNILTNVEIIPDIPSTGATGLSSGFNIYVIYVTRGGHYINIVEFLDDLTLTGFGIQYHLYSGTTYYVDTSNPSHNARTLVRTSDEFFYMAVNFLKFSTAGRIETVFLKMDYNPRLSGMHGCHKWTELTTFGALTVTAIATTSIAGVQRQNYVFDWKDLVTVENGLIRLQQMHPYMGQVLYPKRESQPKHFYDELVPATDCQTLQASSQIELPLIQSTHGAAESITEGTIPDSLLQAQCQGMPISIEFTYPFGGKDPEADVEDIISVVDGVVTVDTTVANEGKPSMQPGFRPIYAKVKNLQSLDVDAVSYHSMPIMVYPHDMLATTKTVQTRATPCLLGSEWPKVLQEGAGDNVYLGMSVDQVQGNVIMCGWSNLPLHDTKLYNPVPSKKKAITLLLNNLGDIQWHYVFKSVKTGGYGDLSAQHCRFSTNSEFIYTLLHDTSGNELSLMKQLYEKGAVAFVRKIPGIFSNPVVGAGGFGVGVLGTSDGQYFFEQEKTASTDYIYISARSTSGANQNSWHVYKIDIGGYVPRQLWHSYKASATAVNNQYQVIDQLGIGANLIAAGSQIDTTVNTMARRHVLLQIDRKTGLYIPTLIYQFNSANTRGSTDANTGVLHTFRSQTFVIDKTAAGVLQGLYHAFLGFTTSDVLHYTSMSETTFAPLYQLDLVIGPLYTMQTWVSMQVDELPPATGYVFVLITNARQDNYFYSFKKSDGSYRYFAKINGHASSVHAFGLLQYYKGVNTGAGTQQFYFSMGATNYVNAKYSGVINKFHGDLTTLETCLGFTPFAPGTLTTSAIFTQIVASRPVATIMSTQLNLNPADGIIGELIHYYGQQHFGLRSAEMLGCQPPPAEFYMGMPENTIFKVNDDGTDSTYTFPIPKANQCGGVLLMGDWEVDNISPSKPDWITMTTPPDPEVLTGNGGTLTLVVNNLLTGFYSVRFKYWSTVNSAKVESNFVLNLYPETDYAHPAPTITCVPDILPVTLGNQAGVTLYDGATDGLYFLTCGKTTSSKILGSASLYDQAFVQILNKNIMIEYQLVFDMNQQNSYMSHCQFGTSGNMYFGINSKSGAATNYDKVYMYKFLMSSAKFGGGKMLSVTNTIGNPQVTLQSMVVSLLNGDQFYGGEIRSLKLNINSANLEAFVLKLNTNMLYVYFKTFQGASVSSVVLNLFADAATGTYALIKSQHSVSGFETRLVKLDYNAPGNQGWAQQIYHSSAMNNPSKYGSIASDASYAYSCITYIGGMPQQTYVMKVNAASGVLQALVEMSSNNAIDCNIVVHQPSNRVLVSLIYNTGIIQINNFRVDGGPTSLTLDTTYDRLKLLIAPFVPQGNGRFVQIVNNDLWFVIPTLNTGLTSLFYTKLTDVALMKWSVDIKCSEIHDKDVSSSYSEYSIDTLGGDSTSMAPSIILNGGAFTANSPTQKQVEQYYLISPDHIQSISYTKYKGLLEDDPSDDLVSQELKFSYSSTCSVWARPTPVPLTNKIGPSGYTIGPDPYVFDQVKLPVTHCQNLVFTYASQLYTGVNPSTLQPIYQDFSSMTPAWISFDNAGVQYTFNPTDNSLVAFYEISLFAIITPVPMYQVQAATTVTNFQLEIRINTPPTFDKYSYSQTNEMYAYQTWSVTAKFENDVEGDTPYMNAYFVKSVSGVVDLNNALDWVQIPDPSFFTVNAAVTGDLFYEFKKPPQPALAAETQNYYLMMIMWDNYNVGSETKKIVQMTVKKNYPPDEAVPGAINYVIPDVKVTYDFKHVVNYKEYLDKEKDEIVFDCSNVAMVSGTPASWVTVTDLKQTGGSLSFSGKVPGDNKWAGDYKFTCIVKDNWNDLSTTHIYTLKVIIKPPLIVTGQPDDGEARLPATLTFQSKSYSSCPWGLPYTRTLYINDTIKWTEAAYGMWMTWDPVEEIINITPNQNNQDQIGTHKLSVELDDSITSLQYITWIAHIIPDYPLDQLIELPNRFAIVDNWFFFDFNKFQIFSNQELDQKTNFQMYFRQKDSKPPSLPYFIKNYTNGTIYGIGTQADIGSFILECVGVDSAGWETAIEFSLTVKPCYYKCSACWNTDYNTCSQCKKGFFLLNAECNDFCPVGTYADEVVNSCFVCSKTCKVCLGPDPTQNCTVCNTGFFKLENGCYEICPDGFWGDRQDYYCKPCNEACTKCDGPLSSQCQRCAEVYKPNDIGIIAKLGYLLVGSECQVPKCADGQYFKWDTVIDVTGNYLGQCDDCHYTCKKCVGPKPNDCVQCTPGLQINETNFCVSCEQINPGFMLNEELECEDRCGDGIIVNKPCDDNNTMNGDGCSKNCYLEFGFLCDKPPGYPCKEVIPPTFKITANSLTNQHFVEFSEPIYVAQDTTIGPENMVVQIIGKKAVYKFSWRIVPDPNNELIPGRQINRFSIKLFDIMSTLKGTENVRISFLDYSQIQDVTGNLLVNNSFAEKNPAQFIYVSEDEASAIAGGGESMKYAFLSALGFQLGLKVIINGSMQYLWGLVHALQVFGYLLLMNIDFPPNLPAFVGYFSIASADTGSMGVSDYIPDIKKFLIKVEDIEGQYDNEMLPPKFVTGEISPYFIISYSDKLSMWMCAIFVLLPILLLFNKMCKKIKIWENILGGFFFNGPLRTITEMYFEMIITILVNTQFVKFRNRSQIIATATAFGFGAFSLLLPFILMTVIYSHRKNVRKRIWKVKFGMLTDEFSQKTILQLYYYPAYLFQRLAFSATIVYMYAYPLIQCFLVAFANLAMVFYLVVIRPYKEENQQTTQVVDELILFVCVLFFVYLYLKQEEMDIDAKKQLGWIIIFIMLFSILKNLFVVLYFGFVNMRKKMKSMFSAEDEALDSPHTSDDNSDTIDSIPTEEIEDEVRREEYEKEEYNEIIKQKQAERSVKAGNAGNNKMDMYSQQQQSQNNRMMSPDVMGPPGSMYPDTFSQMTYNQPGFIPDPYSQQQQFSGYPGFSQQPEQDNYYQEQPPAFLVPPTKQRVPNKTNNFLAEQERPVTANQQLDELEQVANDQPPADYGQEYYYGEYDQEANANAAGAAQEYYAQEGYGQEGYGQEGYGQEAQQPAPVYQTTASKKVKEKSSWDVEQPEVQAAEDYSKVETFQISDNTPKPAKKVAKVPPPSAEPAPVEQVAENFDQQPDDGAQPASQQAKEAVTKSETQKDDGQNEDLVIDNLDDYNFE